MKNYSEDWQLDNDDENVWSLERGENYVSIEFLPGAEKARLNFDFLNGGEKTEFVKRGRNEDFLSFFVQTLNDADDKLSEVAESDLAEVEDFAEAREAFREANRGLK